MVKTHYNYEGKGRSVDQFIKKKSVAPSIYLLPLVAWAIRRVSVCEKEGRKRGSRDVVHLVSTDEEKKTNPCEKEAARKIEETGCMFAYWHKNNRCVWGGGGGGGNKRRLIKGLWHESTVKKEKKKKKRKEKKPSIIMRETDEEWISSFSSSSVLLSVHMRDHNDC